MLGALVKLQAGQLSAADAVLGQHALDSQLHGELGTLSHERAVLDVLEVADPAGVMIVVLLIECRLCSCLCSSWLESSMYLTPQPDQWTDF